MEEGAALGKNHILEPISKRDTSGLKHRDLRLKLREVKPQFIYIHLGVNDILNGHSVEETMQNFTEFLSFRDSYVPNAKVFISLPLPTMRRNYSEYNNKIIDLRDEIQNLYNMHNPSSRKPIAKCKLLLNTNDNLARDGKLKREFCSNDDLHLSDKGKAAILGNFRHHIHGLARSLIGNRN